MKTYNSCILTVALSLLLTTVILTVIGQNSLDVYYTIYILEAFIITELYVFFNTKTRRGLTFVSIILFGGFVSVPGLQAIKIPT